MKARGGGGRYPVFGLIGVLAIALLARAAGLGWGLPGPERYYPYHPDEPVLAMAVLRVDFAALQLSPHFFNYGSLTIYLDRLALDGAARAGWIQDAFSSPEARALALGDVIRVGRWLVVLMGLLTVWATAALGARLYGPGAGLLSALLLAVAPLHLAQGHYFAVDVPATLWTTLCLLLCAGALQRPDRGTLALAGVCAGLAASTKYNAAVVLVAPLYTLAVTWRRPEWYASDRAVALLYTPLAAAAAFLLTTPGILIDSAQFWHDVGFELQHSETGHGLVFVHTPPAWLFHLTRSLPQGLGLPLLAVVLAGVVWAALRHSPEDGLLLLFVAAYALLIGGAQVKFARYLIPLLPPLLLLAARVFTGSDAMTDPNRHGGTEARRSGEKLVMLRTVALGFVLLWTAAYGAAMAAVFTRPDPRDQAVAWVAEHRRPGEKVGLAGEPWFYTPPLAPSLGCTHALQRWCGAPAPDWVIAPAPGQGALPVAALSRDRPAYVIVSEFEYHDPLRLQAGIGYHDGMTALMEALPRQYRQVRTCRNRPTLGPLRWFTSGPPVHDLLYPMPDIRVYQRVAPGQ